MNKVHFCQHCLLWIGSKILRRASLTITLNVRTLNVILLMLITVLRVFLTNPETKRCRRCRATNTPVRKKQKKNCGQKEGGKSKTTSIQLWLIFLKYIFEFLYLPYSWSGFDSQLSVFNHIIFLFGLFPFILTPGPFQPREVFELNVFLVTFI